MTAALLAPELLMKLDAKQLEIAISPVITLQFANSRIAALTGAERGLCTALSVLTKRRRLQLDVTWFAFKLQLPGFRMIELLGAQLARCFSEA